LGLDLENDEKKKCILWGWGGVDFFKKDLTLFTNFHSHFLKIFERGKKNGQFIPFNEIKDI